MNKWNFSKVLLLLALVVGSLTAYSQESNSEVIEAEISTPTNTEFSRFIYLSGDFGLGILDGENTKFKLGYNGHLGIGYQFDKWLGVKLNLGYGSLNGGFDNITIDKLNYFEANVNLTFDLMNIIFGYKADRKFSAVPHVGLGQIHYRLTALNNEGKIYSQIGHQNGGNGSGLQGRKVVATIPLGVEFNYAVNNSWKVFLDLTTNYTDSDLLEGINGDYRNDWFYTINLGTTYRFNAVNDKKVKRVQNETEEETPEKLIKVKAKCCNYWYMAVDGGASFLFGDNKANFSSLESNINIGVGYNFGDYYRVYGRIGKGNISGQEKSYTWAITDGDYLNFSLNVSADVIGLIYKTTDKRFKLYPHVGIGQTQYRTTTSVYNEGMKQIGYNNDNNNNIKGNGINNRKASLTFPVGIELAYNVTNRTDLYADATSNFIQNDLLDCVAAGKNLDAYSTFNIGLRYKFNKSCIEPEECVTPEEVKEAIQRALEQQKAAEEESKPACVTPEELKQAIKDAIDEYEANRPKVDEKFGTLSQATVINNNFSDISFPKNGAQKLKTQTNVGAINSASNQVNDGSAVNRVIIEGYASPEGDKGFNERLARQRAEQAAKIIQNELGEIDAERIEITNKGADWEGLYASLENSEIEGKDDIIEQLKNSENPEATLQEILKSNPQVKQLLPQLRRASIVITTVK